MKQKCKYLSRRGLGKPFSKRSRIRRKQKRRYAQICSVDVHTMFDGLVAMRYGSSILPLLCERKIK